MTCPDAFSFSPSHWGHFIALLSMDMTSAVWPLHKVSFSRDLETIRAELRRMMISLREACTRQPEPFPDIRSWLFEHNALNWPENDLQMLCRIGTSFIADHADDPQISGWQIALDSFPLAYPITVQTLGSKDLVAQMQAQVAPQEIVTMPTQFSPWDLQLCARHGWNPESKEAFPPIDTLDIVTSLWRARDALIFASEQFPPAAQTELWREAAAVIANYGVWMPSPLKPLWLNVDHASLH